MNGRTTFSIGLAVVAHGLILFAIPSPLLRAGFTTPEKEEYVEVALVAPPSTGSDLSEPTTALTSPEIPAEDPSVPPNPPAPEPATPTPKSDPELAPETTPLERPLPPEEVPIPAIANQAEVKVAEPEPEPAPKPPSQDTPVTTEPEPASAQLTKVQETPIQSSADTARTQEATSAAPDTSGRVDNPIGRGASALATDYTPISEPYYLKRAQSKYPAEARRLKQEGVVLLTLYINAAGGLDHIEVTQSSGYPLLDEAAMANEKKSRFRPAMIGNRAVPSKAEVPYRFKLPRN